MMSTDFSISQSISAFVVSHAAVFGAMATDENWTCLI